MKRPRHPVTDHAVVRYLERVRGMDIDAVRAEISSTVEDGRGLGACSVLSNGFRFHLSEAGDVVTVTHACRTELHIGRYKRRRERDE